MNLWNSDLPTLALPIKTTLNIPAISPDPEIRVRDVGIDTLNWVSFTFARFYIAMGWEVAGEVVWLKYCAFCQICRQASLGFSSYDLAEISKCGAKKVIWAIFIEFSLSVLFPMIKYLTPELLSRYFSIYSLYFFKSCHVDSLQTS